jgi:5-deoxy-glucuronate isomerase
MSAARLLNPQTLIFSGTDSRKGRHVSVTPTNSALDHLHYGRIRLDAALPRVDLETEGRETVLLAMRGECGVTVEGTVTHLTLHDAIYIPRGCHVEVATRSEVDLVECSAEVSGEYPLQVIRYADVVASSRLKFKTGGLSTSREVNIVVGDNVRAGRIVAGFTRSAPGNWTSWPPHEHAALLEEVYVYYDMPAPAFGIQMVYTAPDQPEFVSVVREGDAVLMPAGFHPNVAAPGHSINFIWMMAARREVQDRLFGVVNLQPGFDGAGSGLEASRK